MKKILLLTVLLVAAASAAITITFPDGKPTTVGVPVRVVITAGSAERVDLFVNPGNQTWACSTEVYLGDDFKYDGNVEITHPGTGLTLYASKGAESGESEPFDVVAGSAAKWLIIAPGETAAHGEADEPDGKTGTGSVTAGDTADYNVYICDKWNNDVGGSDTPGFTSTDQFFRVKSAASPTSEIELRTAKATQTITVSGGSLTSDFSNVKVNAGPAAKLITLDKGEEQVAGDTTSSLANYPGKKISDSTLARWAIQGVPYVVDVCAVDVCWNTVTTYSASEVNVWTGSDNLTDSTANSIANGFANDVPVWFESSDITIGIPIVAKDNAATPLTSYSTLVKVQPAITSVVVDLSPDTVPTGVHSQLTATAFIGQNRAGSGFKNTVKLIWGPAIYFHIEDDVIETNSEGEATTEVWADSAGEYGIEVTAGTHSDTVVLYVQEKPGLSIYPNPFKYGAQGHDAVNFSYKVEQAGAAEVMLLITDIYGNVVYKNIFTSGTPVQPGQQTISWDIKNGKGNSISSGMYQAVLKITLTNLSTEVLRKNLMVIW